MKLSEYIINDIKPLKIESRVSDLQLLFNQLTFSHIPICNENNAFTGSFSEADAYCFEKTKSLLEYKYAIEDFFVQDTALWLDVLEAFAKNSTNMMPVLNDKNEYLGYYELNDIISLFSDSPFFTESGDVLVIEKGINDYSFSEVSQIVESNGGKILGAFISKTGSDLTQITLKIGQTDITDVIQTFRRYSYNIVSGHEQDGYIETLKERSDYLKKYLNI
ncbi:CBS domain-containing protein [Pseudotamlana carrageenivorans]|uniref:Acetoin utilization protein acuB n=1 Tax=Pseudotamlana carrageenivorans TaxID=2069432 RepID=A0A2I7SFZ3_9FLAO|nr:CBS domain-containing protein [Tamlana carrageenivorans]AUS04831.1 acetoin utilization protein acuB [Tamlana carrageenivorans]